MIRMLHAADLHLDSPFAALDPHGAAQRREDQRRMLRHLVRECDRLECDLLLLAGDLFDTEQIYRETAELLCEILGQCKARVFIAPGNHDPWTPLSPYATLDWPDNVHIFRTREVEAVRLEEPAVTVYGAAFTGPHDLGLLHDFRAEEAPGRAQVMVVHGEYNAPKSVYNPISREEAEASGLDYLALGHIHQASLEVVGKTTVSMPGCPMGRGFDETGPKGVCYVELDGDGCRVRTVDLGARVYRDLTVAVDGDPRRALEEALPQQAGEDICRVTLTGTCPAPDLAALHADFAPRFHTLELIDRTLPAPELWRDLEEDSLKGEYLRQLKECYDGAEDENARRMVAEAVRLGLAIMEGREVPEV